MNCFKQGNEEILVRTGDVRYLKTMKQSLHKKAWNPDIDGLESSDGNWTVSDLVEVSAVKIKTVSVKSNIFF